MFAKACQGQSTKDVIATATGQLKQIYKASTCSPRPALLERPAPVSGRMLSLRGFIEREGTFSWLMLAPGILFLLAFVAYPFFYGIYLSLQDLLLRKRVSSSGSRTS